MTLAPPRLFSEGIDPLSKRTETVFTLLVRTWAFLKEHPLLLNNKPVGVWGFVRDALERHLEYNQSIARDIEIYEGGDGALAHLDQLPF